MLLGPHTRAHTIKRNAAVPAASVGGVSPPDIEAHLTNIVPGTGTVPQLAGADACATKPTAFFKSAPLQH